MHDSARSRRRVINGTDHAGLREDVVVLDKQQVSHQPDNVARCEVVARRLIRLPGNLRINSSNMVPMSAFETCRTKRDSYMLAANCSQLERKYSEAPFYK